MEGISYFRDPSVPFYEIKKGRYNIHSSKKHYHDELSIGVVEGGQCVVNCQGKDFLVDSSKAIVISPNVIHKCTPSNIDSWNFKMLYINDIWFKEVFKLERYHEAVAVKPLNKRQMSRVRSLFRILQRDDCKESRETQLIINLAELFKMDNEICENEFKHLKNPKIINALKEYITNNFLRDITLEDLVEYSGVSKYYIIRLFKENLNTTPHAFQVQMRLNYAKAILRDGVDILSVAMESGFFDQSHFTKAFKEHFGVTPLDYQILKII